jgi:hypothetical protein
MVIAMQTGKYVCVTRDTKSFTVVSNDDVVCLYCETLNLTKMTIHKWLYDSDD